MCRNQLRWIVVELLGGEREVEIMEGIQIDAPEFDL
jgi:hypothetical protein